MSLPKKISPNPLVLATLEVRFASSKLNKENILGTFYPAYSDKYYKIVQNTVPIEIRDQPQFQFASYYSLSNEKYSLGISHNSVAFNNVNGYHLWDDFFVKIKEGLAILNGLNLIKKIQRIGLRYVNIFKNESDLLKVLKVNPALPYEGYESQIQMLNTVYKKNDVTLVLQLSPQALVLDKNPVAGVYIDIDVATSQQYAGTSFDEVIFNKIDLLHTEEKKLFYSLLREDFLETLKPEY